MTNRNERPTTKFLPTDLSAKRDFMASKMMRGICRVTLHRNGMVALTLAVITLISVALASGQVATEQVVPSVIKYSGMLTDAVGKPLTESTELTFALYKTERGGAALWMESQRVEPDKLGNYTVTLGSTTTAGLPATLFAAGEARWLGVEISGQGEKPRVMLSAVPYAMKAGDAETLGGLPASAFIQAGVASNSASTESSSPSGATSTDHAGLPPAGSNVTTTGGTVGAIPVFTTSTDIQNSILTQSGTVGVNVSGRLNLPSNGTATATSGKSSRPEDFVASSFNSSTGAAVAQTFQLQAEPAGNNTASPSGTLSLLFGSGTSSPTETGLKITSKGLISFATGQTFPGTGQGTITGVTAGSGLTGGGTNGNVTLTLDATKVVSGVTAGTDLTGGGTGGVVTLNLDTTKVPQLKSNNIFSGTQQFANTGIGIVPSSTSYTPLSVGTANSFGTWLAISNTSTGGHTWNIISAGGANAEGAGNLGITDLTGKSTIWLEGNTNTGNLTATGNGSGYGLTVVSPNYFGELLQGPESGVGAGLEFQTTGTKGMSWQILNTGDTSAQGANKLNFRNDSNGIDVMTLYADGHVNLNVPYYILGAQLQAAGGDSSYPLAGVSGQGTDGSTIVSGDGILGFGGSGPGDGSGGPILGRRPGLRGGWNYRHGRQRQCWHIQGRCIHHGQSLQRWRFIQDRPPARPCQQVPVSLIRRIARHDEHLQRHRFARQQRRSSCSNAELVQRTESRVSIPIDLHRRIRSRLYRRRTR
jgi:hypothetical protein